MKNINQGPEISRPKLSVNFGLHGSRGLAKKLRLVQPSRGWLAVVERGKIAQSFRNFVESVFANSRVKNVVFTIQGKHRRPSLSVRFTDKNGDHAEARKI